MHVGVQAIPAYVDAATDLRVPRLRDTAINTDEVTIDDWDLLGALETAVREVRLTSAAVPQPSPPIHQPKRDLRGVRATEANV